MAKETTEIATTQTYDAAQYQNKDLGDAAAAAIAGPGFMPRLQLMTGRTAVCQKGDFPPNNYALVDGPNLIDLGKNPDIIAFCWRPVAMDTSGEDFVMCLDPKFDNTVDPPQATGLFLEIMKKSKGANSGCMYGPQFLCWVASKKAFCTFFFGSNSSRKEAPKLQARLCQPTTLGAREITSKKYASWYVPDIKACSTPFDGPNPADVARLANEFNNPPEEAELVAEEEGERER